MFSNIFFLVLLLILIVVGSENSTQLVYMGHPAWAYVTGMFTYVAVIAIIYYQNLRSTLWSSRYKDYMLILANVELFLFFFTYFFIFGSHHLFFIYSFPFSGFISMLLALVMYFGGLAAFHYAYERRLGTNQQALAKMWWQLCFLIPFTLPFLFYKVFSDLALLLPLEQFREAFNVPENSSEESILIVMLSLIFMALVMIVLPGVIVRCWHCRELEGSPLKNRLENLCATAKFKHAGLMTWNVMQDAMTAAIVGVVSHFRYVMFTPRLLKRLSPNAIEAILAHEIGHSKCRHLLLYPLIISGILIFGSVLSLLLYPLVMFALTSYVDLSLQTLDAVSSFVFFVIYASLLAVLFRFIFGYFSRLFERQADLYVFALNIPVAYLIEAFNEIAIDSGSNHEDPNWHHYSIRQRINFLQQVEANRSLVSQHHRKVVFSLIVYCMLMGAFLLF